MVRAAAGNLPEQNKNNKCVNRPPETAVPKCVGTYDLPCTPVLIIQNNIGNLYCPTVIVAAMAGKVRRKAKLPTHYILNGYGGLGEDSIILLEQIRTINKRRLKK